MDLILFRHGIAQDLSSDGSDDARQLTDEGKDRTLAAARGLFKLIGSPEQVIASPKMRALQTAAIFTQVASTPDAIIQPVIASPSTQAIQDFVLAQTCASLLIVGHEPTLSELAETLCTGQAHTGLFQMTKAGAICVRLPDLYRKATIPGTLQWVMPASMLYKIG